MINMSNPNVVAYGNLNPAQFRDEVTNQIKILPTMRALIKDVDTLGEGGGQQQCGQKWTVGGRGLS